MILAGLCSALFSLATPTAMAKGGCSLDLNKPEGLETEIKNKAEKMSKEELETCLNNLEETTVVSDPKKANQITAAMNALSDAIIIKDVTVPFKDRVENGLNVTDMRDNLCICDPTDKTKPNCTDANNIIAVVEEPMETELTNTEQTKVRTCTRNTFCLVRKEKGEMECVTYLNATKDGDKYSPFCSTQAQDYIKANPESKGSLYCQPIQVFLSSTGTDLLFVYISTIYKWAASVIGIIAVLVIVISGIQISAAAGEQQAVTNAKNRIIQTLGGLALLFLSAIILYTINPNFFTAG